MTRKEQESPAGPRNYVLLYVYEAFPLFMLLAPKGPLDRLVHSNFFYWWYECTTGVQLCRIAASSRKYILTFLTQKIIHRTCTAHRHHVTCPNLAPTS
jgi:hypothetical protein